MLVRNRAQREQRLVQLWVRYRATRDLHQLTGLGSEEAQSSVASNMQTNARAVSEWLIGGDEAELREHFEMTDAGQGVT